jgi:hypothetical protein
MRISPPDRHALGIFELFSPLFRRRERTSEIEEGRKQRIQPRISSETALVSLIKSDGHAYATKFARQTKTAQLGGSCLARKKKEEHCAYAPPVPYYLMGWDRCGSCSS